MLIFCYAARYMNLEIIYEDNDVIVIDKPAGIAAHPIGILDNKPTIAGMLLQNNPEIKSVGDNPLRPGIVHRLDKETSGLMIVAKSNEAFYELKKQFQERGVEKRYIALVSGTLEKDKGVIDTALVKMGTKTTTAPVGGRPAASEYTVKKRYKDYTLVEVQPKTGRQHQIRVHFASINHPLACDKLYGRRAKNCPVGLNRHFLHASYLKFQLKNALMEFESKLPKDLENALEVL